MYDDESKTKINFFLKKDAFLIKKKYMNKKTMKKSSK